MLGFLSFSRKIRFPKRGWTSNRSIAPLYLLILLHACSPPAPRLLHACSTPALSGLTNPLLLSLSRQSIRHQVPSTEHQVPSAKYHETIEQSPRRSMPRCAAPVYRAACSIRRSTPVVQCDVSKLSVRVKSKTTPLTPHAAAANAADLHRWSTVTPAERSLPNAENPVFYRMGWVSGLGSFKFLALQKKPNHEQGATVRRTLCASKSRLASLTRIQPTGRERRFGQHTVGHSRRRFGEPLSEHIKAKKASKTPPRGQGATIRLLFCPLQGRSQTALGTRSRL